MAYTIPTFNLTVNIWHPPQVTPPIGLPQVVVLGNLTPGKRHQWGTTLVGGYTYILLPALTDIRITGVAEIPAGSGRYYKIGGVEDLGKGFPNEHRYAVILADYVNWPVPYP